MKSMKQQQSQANQEARGTRKSRRAGGVGTAPAFLARGELVQIKPSGVGIF